MAEGHAELQSHKKACMTVFWSLMVLTVVTVLAAYIPGMPRPAAITLALLIASTKGTLVALYFMHLVSEKSLIYWTMGMTGLFFVALMVLIIANDTNLLGAY